MSGRRGERLAPAASSRLSETRLLRDRVAMGDGQGSGLDVQVDNHVGLHNFRFMDHPAHVVQRCVVQHQERLRDVAFAVTTAAATATTGLFK